MKTHLGMGKLKSIEGQYKKEKNKTTHVSHFVHLEKSDMKWESEKSTHFS